MFFCNECYENFRNCRKKRKTLSNEVPEKMEVSNEIPEETEVSQIQNEAPNYKELIFFLKEEKSLEKFAGVNNKYGEFLSSYHG